MSTNRGSVAREMTVEQVMREWPATLEVFKAHGVNHCCGAHLPLDQAAAAAGAPLEALLRELDAAAKAPDQAPTLDVRGLAPPEPLVRVLEAVEALAPGGSLEVVHDRRPKLLYPQLEARGFTHETDEPAPGVVRIRIRRPPTRT